MAEAQMRAVIIEKFGGPEVMKTVEIPVPEPGAGEVRVKVEAIGLNYSDIMIREGLYIDEMPLPYGLGREFCGTVDKLGEGVTNLKEGQRIAGTAPSGAIADFVCAGAAGAFPVPESMSPEQGASIMLQGLTAIHIIDDYGKLQAGETLLVHAAAGGVGTLAVQIGLARGAKVIGTTSSDEKCKVVTDLGAEAVNYSKPDWVDAVKKLTDGRGADVILESVGGDIFRRSFDEALAIFGRMVVFGVASGEVVEISNRDILASNKTIVGYYLGSYFPDHLDRVMSASGRLMQLLGQGKVKPIIGQTFALDETVEAFNCMQQRKSIGKVVILP